MDPVTRSKEMVNYKGFSDKPIRQKSCDYTDVGGWERFASQIIDSEA